MKMNLEHWVAIGMLAMFAVALGFWVAGWRTAGTAFVGVGVAIASAPLLLLAACLVVERIRKGG